jgi:c-di-GMP-binding flagellar brake protein YcgR
MTPPTGPAERRRAVRMKPIPDCPASAVRLGEHPEALTISDVSVGGIAFQTLGSLKNAQVNQRLDLRMSLARYGEHTISAVVRYVNDDGLTGAQFVDLSPEATKAVRHYVAELLQRGAPS